MPIPNLPLMYIIRTGSHCIRFDNFVYSISLSTKCSSFKYCSIKVFFFDFSDTYVQSATTIVSGIPISVANTPAVPGLFLYKKYVVPPENNTQIMVSTTAMPI